MKVKFNIENNRIVGYQTFPIVEDMIEVEDIPNDVCNGEYNLVNGVITKVGYTSEMQEKINEEKLNEKRFAREPLLKAFDKYRSAVSYGIVIETEEEHQTILTWYSQLLDIETANITKKAVPAKVAYYL